MPTVALDGHRHATSCSSPHSDGRTAHYEVGCRSRSRQVRLAIGDLGICERRVMINNAAILFSIVSVFYVAIRAGILARGGRRR